MKSEFKQKKEFHFQQPGDPISPERPSKTPPSQAPKLPKNFAPPPPTLPKNSFASDDKNADPNFSNLSAEDAPLPEPKNESTSPGTSSENTARVSPQNFNQKKTTMHSPIGSIKGKETRLADLGDYFTGGFGQQEYKKLFRLAQREDFSWVKIARDMPGRNPNYIKTVFNSSLRAIAKSKSIMVMLKHMIIWPTYTNKSRRVFFFSNLIKKPNL